MAKGEFRLFSYRDDAGRPVEFDMALEISLKSRESCGVWIRRGRAWKIFTGRGKQYEKLKADYALAAERNVPLPTGTRFYEGTIFPCKGRPKEGFAIVSACITASTRFSLSKGTGSFKNTIDRISNVAILRKIEQGLGAAVAIKLTDPQGFIDPTNTNNPIVFIDIHTNSAAVELEEMRKYVSQRRQLRGQ